MSGHSKWSKIKHQKETTDAARGKMFSKLSKELIIAVKQSGGNTDPGSNFRLKIAIDKARSFNMPKDNIERTIEKAKGAADSASLREIVYEAFGPSGIGIIIETATDNRLRTVAEIKNVLERGGGSLATSGAVSHFFKYVGCLTLPANHKSFDEVMELAINAGAIDLEDLEGLIEVYTAPADLHKVKDLISKGGFTVSSAELVYRPISTIPIQNASEAKKILQLLSALEEIEDVQHVFANFDIPDKYIS